MGACAVLVLLYTGATLVSGCTTLIAGRGATVDGSVMATHSDDGESGGDARVVKVPAMDWARGSKRPIYYATEDYPRFVGERGVDAYRPANNPGAAPSVPLGFIEQVNHTFGYYEATYGILNEHQVGIGESTCSAVFGASAIGHGGDALLSVDALSRLAMERATTAREAVALMGAMAEAHGFYGANAFEGTGESLMVIDPREGFIFHILPDPTGRSAIWAAQRVPDSDVGAVANMFTIRQVLPQATTAGLPDFLYSASLHAVAQARGWWSNSDGPLDFTRVYSDGEYAHKFYSGRRVWGAYRLLVPESPLPANYTDLRTQAGIYPATLATSRKLSPLDLMAVHRDMYEGTPYDMTKGAAAGAFGNPDRYAASRATTLLGPHGSWERSIALYRTTASHVVQARAWLPDAVGGVAWFGPHAAHGTCYVPLHAGAASVPNAYTVANPSTLSRASAYWAHKYVLNVARARYSDSMRLVSAVQQALEAAAWAKVRSAGTNATHLPDMGPRALAADAAADSEAVLAAWWALPDQLMEKFADGWLDDGAPMGYPDAWLKSVGWQDGPPRPPKDPTLPHCCQPSFIRGAPSASSSVVAEA